MAWKAPGNSEIDCLTVLLKAIETRKSHGQQLGCGAKPKFPSRPHADMEMFGAACLPLFCLIPTDF